MCRAIYRNREGFILKTDMTTAQHQSGRRNTRDEFSLVSSRIHLLLAWLGSVVTDSHGYTAALTFITEVNKVEPCNYLFLFLNLFYNQLILPFRKMEKDLFLDYQCWWSYWS